MRRRNERTPNRDHININRNPFYVYGWICKYMNQGYDDVCMEHDIAREVNVWSKSEYIRCSMFGVFVPCHTNIYIREIVFLILDVFLVLIAVLF